MSSNVTTPSKKRESGVKSSPSGKAKAKDPAHQDGEQEEEDDDDSDDDDDEDDEMESGDEEDEESQDAIDPTVIQSRRTRGIRVDYASKEAREKAGLEGAPEEDDDDDEMKE